MGAPRAAPSFIAGADRIDVGAGPRGAAIFRPRRPRGRARRRLLHGWIAVDPELYGPWIAHLVHRGATVVYPAYQEAPFLDTVSPLPNALVALRLAFEQVPVAAGRLIVAGHSAGGALAHYALGSGSGELDLRETGLRKGQTLRSSARVGAGQLKVVVPADALVEVTMDVGVGETRVPRSLDADGNVASDSSGGFGQERKARLRPFGGTKPRGTVELKLSVGIGQAEIVRGLPEGDRSARWDGSRDSDRSDPAGPSAPSDPDPAQAPRPPSAPSEPTQEGGNR